MKMSTKVKIKRRSKCKHSFSLNCLNRSDQATDNGGGGSAGGGGGGSAGGGGGSPPNPQTSSSSSSPPNTKSSKKYEVVSIESSTERQRRKNLSLPLPENGVTTPVAADALASPNDVESGWLFDEFNLPENEVS